MQALETLPRDTSIEASRIQVAAWRRMGDSGRFRATMDMIAFGRQLAAVGIRQRHPDYAEEQVRLAVIRLCLGDDLFRRAYPGVSVEP